MYRQFSRTALRRLRRAAGLSRFELATRLCMKEPTVIEWERGRRVPRTNLLPFICDALGCELAELFEDVAA